MRGWLKGGIFFAVFLLLIFFLKIVCPLDIGCFVDPFLPPIFSPLLLIEFITDARAYETLGSLEPAFVFIFWVFIGGVLGQLFEKFNLFKKLEEDDEVDREVN